MSEEKPGQSADKDEDDKKEEERRRFDYVIVVDKNIKKSAFYKSVVKFLNYLQGRGVAVELAYEDVLTSPYASHFSRAFSDQRKRLHFLPYGLSDSLQLKKKHN
jgi:hypothetical protein